MFYLALSVWLRESDVRSGLLFVEFQSDWFLCECSGACATAKQREAMSEKVCMCCNTTTVRGMGNQYVRPLGARKIAVCAVCFRHSRSPVDLSVDLLIS